jgi:hypothetical protein
MLKTHPEPYIIIIPTIWKQKFFDARKNKCHLLSRVHSATITYLKLSCESCLLIILGWVPGSVPLPVNKPQNGGAT